MGTRCSQPVAIALCLLFSAACDRPSGYEQADLPGTYELRYNDSEKEVLILRSDGRFEQQFGEERNAGTWEYLHKRDADHLYLRHHRVFVGTWAMPKGWLDADLFVRRTTRGPELVLIDDVDWVFRLRPPQHPN